MNALPVDRRRTCQEAQDALLAHSISSIPQGECV